MGSYSAKEMKIPGYIKFLAGTAIVGIVLLTSIFYAVLKKHETYREYFSAQLSRGGFKYEQEVDDTVVYVKILETEYIDIAGSNFWTKKRKLGAPYKFLIASLNYNRTQEPLIITGVWLSIDGQPEILLRLNYPLEIEYEDGDPGTAFRFASHSVSLDDILKYEPEREIIARVEYKQPSNDKKLTIKTRFESRLSLHSISILEIILLGG